MASPVLVLWDALIDTLEWYLDGGVVDSFHEHTNCLQR